MVIPTRHWKPKPNPQEEDIDDILTVSSGGAAHGNDQIEGRCYACDLCHTMAKKHSLHKRGPQGSHHFTPRPTDHYAHHREERWRKINAHMSAGGYKSIHRHHVLRCLCQMQPTHSQEQLDGGRTPIRGFGQNDILVAGLIKVLVMLGKHHQETTLEITFTIVCLIFGYNTIVNQVALHAFQAVISSFCQCLKFPIEVGICVVQGLQRKACECYINSMGKVLTSTWEKNGLLFTSRDSTPCMSPTSLTNNIQLQDLTIPIECDLSPSIKQELVDLLQANKYLFTKGLKELGVVVCTLMEHYLNV